MDKVPKWNIVSVNFPRALLSLLDFSTLEDEIDRLSQNDSKELPLYAAWYPSRAHASCDLVMQALVWLHMV